MFVVYQLDLRYTTVIVNVLLGVMRCTAKLLWSLINCFILGIYPLTHDCQWPLACFPGGPGPFIAWSWYPVKPVVIFWINPSECQCQCSLRTTCGVKILITPLDDRSHCQWKEYPAVYANIVNTTRCDRPVYWNKAVSVATTANAI